jgi:hypothetical protein
MKSGNKYIEAKLSGIDGDFPRHVQGIMPCAHSAELLPVIPNTNGALSVLNSKKLLVMDFRIP